MKLYIALALGGIPLGAMYALQALGVVIVYKTSGVFNFAVGAMGLASAYLASTLVSAGVPVGIALVVAVALGVLLGLAVEISVRPVRNPLSRTIVTLGWLLALQGLVGAVYGNQVATHEPARPFPSTSLIDTDLLQLSSDQVAVILVTAALALGLYAFFRYTALGTATRAVASGPEMSALLGVRIRRVRAVAWGLGGGIAALAGVLVTPLLNQLDTTTLVVFTIQSLAAAMVGRLTSLPLTLLGGILLGMVQPVVTQAISTVSDVKGTDELTAFAVIVVALFAFRRSGSRRDVQAGGLPPAPLPELPRGRNARVAAAGVGLAVVLIPLIAGTAGNFSRYNVAEAAVWSLAVLSLVLLIGVAGQVSACQAVFMGIGAFGTGIAEAHGLPFLLAMLIGAALAAVAAALVGLPAVRLEPLELAIVTVSLAFTADRFLYSWSPLVSPAGTRDVARPGFADTTIHLARGQLAYAWIGAVAFVVACAAVALLRRGRVGAALTALRSSEPAATAMGWSVPWLKLQGFAASGLLAGLAGALYAGLVGTADGAPFDFTRSLTLLAFAVIVGAGSVPGALVGGLIITVSTLSFGSGSGIASDRSAAVVTLITGTLLIAVLVGSPDGLVGLARRGWSRWGSRVLPSAAGEATPA